MNRLILTMSFLLTMASVSVLAQEAIDSVKAPPQTSTAAPKAAPDSPLVRAAKSASRGKKKPAPVITNDSLLKSGGHITTAKSLPPIPRRVDSPPEMTVDQARAAEKKNREIREAAAAKVKKAEEDRKLQKERNAAIYQGDDAEGMLEDPSLAEGRMNPPTKTDAPPPQKPPAR